MGGFPPPAPLNLHYGDLKLRNLTKLLLFKLIMTKPNFKNIDMTSF